MKFRIFSLPLVAAFALTACSCSTPTSHVTTNEDEMNHDERMPSSERSDAYPSQEEARAFDLKFFKSVYEKEGSGNFLMSPTSIRLLLGMVYLGTNTGSQSEKELARALGVSTDKSQARQQLLGLARTFRLDGEVKIDSGNIVYARRPLEKAWMDDVRKTFQALAFDDKMLGDRATVAALEKQLGLKPGTITKDPAHNMSRYVEKVTNNMIKDFVKKEDVSDPLLVAVLVNALYFKGTWQDKFHPLRTRKGKAWEGGGKADYMVRATGKEFKLEEGKCVEQKVENQLYQSDRVQVLAVPFKLRKVKENIGGREYERDQLIASMYFILPRKGVSLDSFVASDLTQPGWWETVRKGLEKYEMTRIEIPKFKYETDIFDLMAHAKKPELGISGFIKRPEVHGISKEIDEVTKFAQQAAVKVNEEGAELAAATKIAFATRSMPRRVPQAEFLATRPFAYALVIHEKNEVAFLGTVKKPEYKTDGEPAYNEANDPLAACYR